MKAWARRQYVVTRPSIQLGEEFTGFYFNRLIYIIRDHPNAAALIEKYPNVPALNLAELEAIPVNLPTRELASPN